MSRNPAQGGFVRARRSRSRPGASLSLSVIVIGLEPDGSSLDDDVPHAVEAGGEPDAGSATGPMERHTYRV